MIPPRSHPRHRSGALALAAVLGLALLACQPREPAPPASSSLPFPLQISANTTWQPPIACAAPTERHTLTLEKTLQAGSTPQGAQTLTLPLGRDPRALCAEGAIRASHPGEIRQSNEGSLIGAFQIPPSGPFQTHLFKVTVQVSDPSSDQGLPARAYLEGDAHHPVHTPEIQGVSITLRDPDPVIAAANVRRWMQQHIRAEGYAKQDRGALWALEKGYGDCTDVSALAVSLYRAVGVPARVVSGYVCTEGGGGSGGCEGARPHAWVERWDGEGWVEEDLSLGMGAARVGLEVRGGSGDAPARYEGLKVTLGPLSQSAPTQP